MKNKAALPSILVTLGLLTGLAGAQEIARPGGFEGLLLDVTRIAVRGTLSPEVLSDEGLDPGALTPWPIQGWSLLGLPVGRSTSTEVLALVQRLARRDGAAFVSPVFVGLDGGPVFATQEILVGFDPGIDPVAARATLAAAGAGTVLEEDWGGMPRAFRLRSTSRSGLEVLTIAAQLSATFGVRFAEPNAIFTGRPVGIPNDPDFGKSWGLHNTGQNGGLVDFDMDAPQAWDITQGDPSIKIVIIDTGVQQDHPDLNQVGGTDVTSDGPGNGGPVNGFENHGTAVAGPATEKINNGIGTSGVAPACVSASARTFIAIDATGTWTTQVSWTVDALVWAESIIGARVTNNSNLYGFTSGSIDTKYTQTRDGGMVHFASAGNAGAASLAYPASIPTVNAVGALDRTGVLASFSNYGPGLAFVAPGEDIYTTDRTGPEGYDPVADYAWVNGTSFASPYAAGVAALILSRRPFLTAQEVEDTMAQTAVDLGAPGYDLLYGNGFVNALTAVAAGRFGTQEVITTQADGARCVYAADLDGDGDADALSASLNDDKIAWYENLGTGTFGPQQIITVQADWAESVYATDLDGDGDADVLSASAYDDKIAWYENLSNGSFGPQQVISTQADGAAIVYASDLDCDGDADVLSASPNDDKIAWYENLGGGSFGLQQVISTQAHYAKGVYATDLDGDGDPDVLSASLVDDKIAWYENLGGGSFGPQQVISTQADGATTVYATDLDGDGDPDVLSASLWDYKIAWYENLGGGSFGPQQVISTQADYATGVYATDLDGDGDPDVLSASWDDGKVAWYENLGSGSFGPQQVISIQTGAASVYATDLDGDGSADVLSASVYDDKIAWYENLRGGSLGIAYCQPAVPNSACQPGAVHAQGSPTVLDNDVLLVAKALPPGMFGLFLNSQTQGFAQPPKSQGNICLSGAIGRYTQNVVNSGPAGAVSLQLDLANTPTPTGTVAIQPGETWNFQLWYRDFNPNLTSNFTDAVSITFQ
jgi:Subtilase family/FG-GAP-like repeat